MDEIALSGKYSQRISPKCENQFLIYQKAILNCAIGKKYSQGYCNLTYFGSNNPSFACKELVRAAVMSCTLASMQSTLSSAVSLVSALDSGFCGLKKGNHSEVQVLTQKLGLFWNVSHNIYVHETIDSAPEG